MTALLLALACSSKLPSATLTIDGHSVSAEIAANDADRQQGLMFRDRLPKDSGMLFVYPETKVRGFWMKDTRIPLSIAFADADDTAYAATVEGGLVSGRLTYVDGKTSRFRLRQ
mgnify:CR=1 FL=1